MDNATTTPPIGSPCTCGATFPEYDHTPACRFEHFLDYSNVPDGHSLTEVMRVAYYHGTGKKGDMGRLNAPGNNLLAAFDALVAGLVKPVGWQGDADVANRLFGDAYGVDWVYASPEPRMSEPTNELTILGIKYARKADAQWYCNDIWVQPTFLNRVADLETALTLTTQRAEAAEQRVFNFAAALEVAEAERDALRKENALQDAVEGECISDITTLMTERKALREQLRLVTAERDALTQRAEATRRERDEWVNKFEDLSGMAGAERRLDRDRIHNVTAERDALRDQLQEIHEREAACCGEVESFDERIRSLESTQERREKIIDALRKDAEAANKLVTDKHDVLVAMKKERDAALEGMDALRKRYEGFMAQIKERHRKCCGEDVTPSPFASRKVQTACVCDPIRKVDDAMVERAADAYMDMITRILHDEGVVYPEHRDRAIRAALDAALAVQPCSHEWTDARNATVLSGDVCFKCGAIRPSGAST